MSLKWTDTQDIAIALAEAHPDVDPRKINFVDLRDWVCALEDFSDDPSRSGEKILEAIQMAWIEDVSRIGKSSRHERGARGEEITRRRRTRRTGAAGW